jgi:hypothetical protein
MTQTQLSLLSLSASVLADSSHLLAADEAHRESREQVLDAPGREFYDTRLGIVQRAHTVASRVTAALLVNDSPAMPDVLAVTQHAGLFAQWFGERQQSA